MVVSSSYDVEQWMDAPMMEPNPIEFTPRYNIAPTDPILAATSEGFLSWFRWGLVPSWAKDPSIGTRMINARSETLKEKPAFRAALLRRRCAIPANGFYEWRNDVTVEAEGLFGDPKTTTVKQPYLFEIEDGALFAFAGLWDSWTSPDGSELRSCTIITTGPNKFMEPYHDRMPCILKQEDVSRWIAPEATDVRDLLTPISSWGMSCRKVNRRVGRPGHEGIELLTA